MQTVSEEDSMKRLISGLCAMMIVGLFSVASAIDWSYVTGDVDGGVSQPVGVFAHDFNTGFNLGTNWFYNFPGAGLGLRLGYNRFG